MFLLTHLVRDCYESIDGPSILMTERIMPLTASYSSPSAQSYRAKQAKYIEEGN